VNANTGDPLEWGKTGTTENNGDAWFVGATKDVTVAVWVGHPNSLEPMLTEYGGAPVDGGTIPALIFNEVINAYENLKAQRNPGHHSSTSGETTTTAPAPAPTAPAPTTPAPSQSAPAPSQQHSSPPPSSSPPSAGGGGGGSGGGSPGPTSGGVAG
jgi:penicillin-binding protein 1A